MVKFKNFHFFDTHFIPTRFFEFSFVRDIFVLLLLVVSFPLNVVAISDHKSNVSPKKTPSLTNSSSTSPSKLAIPIGGLRYKVQPRDLLRVDANNLFLELVGGGKSKSGKDEIVIESIDGHTPSMNLLREGNIIFIEESDSKQPSAKLAKFRISGASIPIHSSSLKIEIQIKQWQAPITIGTSLIKLTAQGVDPLNLFVESQRGEVVIKGSKTNLKGHFFKTKLTLEQNSGEFDISNFSGLTTLYQNKGLLNFTTRDGTIISEEHLGNIRFDSQRGNLNFVDGECNINGIIKEGTLKIDCGDNTPRISLESEDSNVRISAKKGRVRIANQEGEVFGPEILARTDDASGRSLIGKLSDDPGSIVIKAKSGTVKIK